VEFKKSDSRFRPDTLQFETVAGAGQFGMSFDEFGRRFVCSNRNPLQHIVLESRYLRRNPYLAFSETVQDVAPAGPAAKVWPISPDTTTASFMPELMGSPHAGTFTSACGCLIYRGEMLGSDFLGNAFVCEPAQNLIQRQVLSPAGASFKAQPAHPGADFLTSPDTWFRPVFAAEGPEDALYVCDMYRKVIDHPQYLPEAVRAVSDFDAGKDKGRIYRIVSDKIPAKDLAAARSRQLSGLTASQLCIALSSSNGWRRATAFRLLLESKDESTVPTLGGMVGNSQLLAQTRVAALSLLNALGQLDLKTLELALDDSQPGVRENACSLAEARLNIAEELLERVSKLGYDPEPRVRFQCALVLGEATSPAKMNVLAGIALRDGADPWTRAAVLSSVGNQAEDFLTVLMATRSESAKAMAAVMTDLSHIFGLGQPPEKCLRLLNQITGTVQSTGLTWQAAAVEGLAEGLRSRGLAHEGLSPIQSLVSMDSDEARLGHTRFEDLLEHAIIQARSPATSPSQRLAAIALLGEAGRAETTSLLLKLIAPAESTEVQTAAVRACGRLQDPDLVKALVVSERWRAYLPQVREAVLSILMSRPRNFPVLLDAVEQGDIPAWSIDPARRRQLTQYNDPAIKNRALALFKDQESGDRHKIYESYKSVLDLPGNSKNGHEMFKKICAQCHTYGGEGVAVGPDLTGVQNQPAEALLLHILIPSYEIVPGFTSYNVETRDGQMLTGLIVSETATTITLKRSLGATDSVLRSNIATISSSGLSLMPDELEKTMTRQELADLIAFLKSR
jgi:putative heme-binding domain-containing protein